MGKTGARGCVFLLSMLGFASAENLMEVYQEATSNSPILKEALATQEAAISARYAQRAELLPAVLLSAGGLFSNQNGASYRNDSFSVSLSQPVFNVNALGAYQAVKATARGAEATYQDALLQFMLQVTGSYFTRLQRQDQVKLSVLNLQALSETYDQTRRKFEAGVVTVTDLRQAQADNDRAKAQLIQDQNQLAISTQALEEITGKRYETLSVLSDRFPYAEPIPNSSSAWVQMAGEKNWLLKAQQAETSSSLSSVIAADGNFLPEVNLVTTYSGVHTNNAHGITVLGLSAQTRRDVTVALQATWTLFAGGAYFGEAWQAAATYDQEVALESGVYRNLLSQTRQDYLAVTADISMLQAYQQAVVASRDSFHRYQEQYRVGTETIVNVLSAITALFEAEKNLLDAKYRYINDWLKLKYDAGVLSVKDLQWINSFLDS